MGKERPIALWIAAVWFVATAAPGAAYRVVTVENGGSVSGTVTYAGTPPPRGKIKVDKDIEVCGANDKFTEDLVVSDTNKGIRNVVVSIRGMETGKALVVPEAHFVLDQKGCWFTPHVQIVPAGATVDVLNMDGIMHNIHTLSVENPSFNKAQPKFKKKMQVTLEYPETIRVKCDIHGWMGGWIIVAEHPYYALTDESGAFRIRDIPPGTYTLSYWHESLGRRTKEVTVTAKTDTNADISMEPRAKKR